MWHEAIKSAVEAGKLVVLGITQEQHPERCQLFAQWHEFEWPILHDPVNLMGAVAVPLTIAIDEHGIVRQTRPRPDTFEADFLSRTFDATDTISKEMNLGPSSLPELKLHWENSPSAETGREYADAMLLWKKPRPLNEIINVYERAKAYSDPEGRIDFRLGVALRMRYESSEAIKTDFQNAVDAWQRALTTSPNQYIWRRRIQQYGPRLDKPYSFYDWVETARAEIRERGDTPVELPVEPQGAELAQPARALEQRVADIRVSDPEGKVTRDTDAWIKLESVVVQGTGNSDSSFRVHLEFTPNGVAHWNNEADPLVVWLSEDDAYKLESTAFSLNLPTEPTSTETRHIEFEVKTNIEVDASDKLPPTIRGYALYNICEDANGLCLFRRMDFEVPLRESK